MIYAILGIIVLAIVFLPSMWVKYVMEQHNYDRPDFPGTGGELAAHLLTEAGIEDVTVEIAREGDHYDPKDKAVRLSPANHDGRSLTAVAVATHEVAHALQDSQGYAPLKLRTRMAKAVHMIQRVGSGLLVATPLIAVLTRAPSVILLEVVAGLALIGSSAVAHAVTLPVEFDASFKRALPILERGKYVGENDMPAARKILKAAALTYVAAALMSLLDIARWLRLLRF
ncbi:MAG: zinc metallopeptidase [Alphaproteobacteria bacterium]|nr:zinc metallopeptidase [Alphaproteobacteria bacterium]